MDASADPAAVLLEFTAAGPARQLATAIEAFAAERRMVTALLVPWESDAVTLRMAVTSCRSDGWAIEHTNLGTVALTEMDGGRARVAVLAAASAAGAADAGHAAVLTAFARQIEERFGGARER